MGCNSRPAEGVAAEIFVVVPDHIVEADGDATIILVDDLVVVPGHPAHAPVIRHVFTGQRVGAQRGPDAVSLPRDRSSGSGRRRRRGRRPSGAGMAAAVLLPAKGEQRAGDRPPVDVDRVPHRPDVAAVAQPPHHIDDIEAHRRGADIPAPVSFFQPTATLAPLSV